MTRTAIYGGSFNPIHTGHTLLCQALLDQGLADEVWLVVSPRNPFKPEAGLLPGEERLRLARLATTALPGVRVSDVEMRMPRPSYMADTLQALALRHPSREFILCIGADNWPRFPQWRRSAEILARHRLIILPRPGCTPGPLPGGVTLAHTPLLPVSSTEIRRRIPQPGYRGEGLHPAVWEEIRLRKLYNYT